MILSCYKKLGELTEDVDETIDVFSGSGLFDGIEVVLSDPSVFRGICGKELEVTGEKLAPFSVSTHLPFYDLNFGSPDPFISKYSVDVMLEALEVSLLLGSSIAVSHINLNRSLPEKAFKKWWKGFVEAKNKIEKKADELGLTVVWENTYENDFKVFDMMLEENDKTLFCLDVGHCNCFADFTALQFIERYGKSVKHIHLHDNFGDEDSHLVPGKGNIDFVPIMERLCVTDVDTAVFEIKVQELVGCPKTIEPKLYQLIERIKKN